VEVPQLMMNIDGSAGKAMYRFNGDITSLDFLKYDVTNLAYLIRSHGSSAVIGVGGGRDMLSAQPVRIQGKSSVVVAPFGPKSSKVK
jgi:hypothetical protein